MCSLGEPNGERAHQAAVAVALFKEPLPPQRLASNPVQKISVDLGTTRLHEIAGEAITRPTIKVQNTEAWIEAECSKS